MSEYYLGLSEEGKERYQRKLKVSGLLLKEDHPIDPANDTRFLDNMGLWPQMEYGNILYYGIVASSGMVRSSSISLNDQEY